MLELAVENYRRFLCRNEVTFPVGLTIVTGPNGAGKSTLCEAITYALFGPPKGRAGVDVRSDNGTGQVMVSCTLKVGGQAVLVQRLGTWAGLTVDGADIVPAQPGSMDIVTRRLQVLLGGLSRDQFEQIYMAEQGDTAGLLAKGDAARKALLEKALDMDVLSEAYSLQDEEREEQQGDVRAKGVELAEKTGLRAEKRYCLDQLARAHKEGSRRQHLNRFLGACQAAVKELETIAQKARKQAAEAAAVQSTAKKARDAAHAEMERARSAVGEHEERRFQDEGLGKQINTAMRQVNKAAERVRVCERAVTAAEACAGAAARLRVAQASLDRLKKREADLAVASERWNAVVGAVRAVARAREALAKLGDPSVDLGKAHQAILEAEEQCRLLEVDPTTQAAEALAGRRGALEQQEQDNRTALQAIDANDGDAPCPTCNQPLPAHARAERIAHLGQWLERELPALAAALNCEEKALTANRQAWLSARKKAKDQLCRAQEAEKSALRRADAVDRHAKQLLEAQDQLRDAHNRWRKCDVLTLWGREHELTEMRAAVARRVEALQQRAAGYADLPRLQKDLEKAQQAHADDLAELARLEANRAKLGYDPEMHQQACEAFKAAEDQFKAWNDKALPAANRAAWDAERTADQAEERYASAKPVLAELEAKATNYLRHECLLTLLGDFKELYYKRNMAAIEERASALIVQAVRDGSLQGVRLGESRLRYLDGSHTLQDATRLSGGEKALVGLCLRIAVAEQALSIAQTGRPHFLILDEVLSSLDEERLEQVQQVFNEVVQRGLFEHIIMVTHLEPVKQTWQGARLDVRKDMGAATSTITFIEGSGGLTGEDNYDE